MKKYILILVLNFCVILSAQISIGTNTISSSAILELNTSNLSSKKGFLPPRVQLNNNIDNTTIPNPVVGMTAYNKASSGVSLNIIDANSLVVWDGTIWQKISNLEEIRSLKFPQEYALASTAQQNLSTTNQLTTINLSSPVELNLVSSEVQIDSPNDIQLSSNHFKFLKTAYFQFSGMVTVKVNTTLASSATQIVLALQVSKNNGGTWTSFFANTLPIEQYASNNPQTITIPNILHSFSTNDLVRVVLFKPASATSYSANSGVLSNQTADIVKSLRILRIEQ